MRRACGFVLMLSLILGAWGSVLEASEPMKIDAYLRLVMRENRTLRAGINYEIGRASCRERV